MNPERTCVIVLACVLGLTAVGCGPTVRLRVLEPADVNVPPHVETLAVVDRSRAAGAGEGFLGVIEGALSGEQIGADTVGRRSAVDGVGSGLQNSPRFRVIRTITDRQEVASSLFDTAIPWGVARDLCVELGCDGIVALESFDSDSHVDHSTRREEYEDDEGKERTRTVHVVQRRTSVDATWRLYDVEHQHVIDDDYDYARSRTWNEEGRTEGEARDRLPDQHATVKELGFELGETYARRIAPSWTVVARSYYARGDDSLKQAKGHVRCDDWGTARQLWHTLLESDDPRIRGMAAFNLALACEVEGQLDEALSWITRAAKDLPKNKVYRYLHELEHRLTADERVRKQMRGVR